MSEALQIIKNFVVFGDIDVSESKPARVQPHIVLSSSSFSPLMVSSVTNNTKSKYFWHSHDLKFLF